jgi:hypothetical protein
MIFDQTLSMETPTHLEHFASQGPVPHIKYQYIIIMATAIIVLCLCSSLSSSGLVGGFFGGFIPGTVPHYARITEADKLKPKLETLKLEDIEGSTFDTWGSPGYCQELKTYTELADAYSPSEIPIGPITLGKDQRIKYEYQHFDNNDIVKKLYDSYPYCKGFEEW